MYPTGTAAEVANADAWGCKPGQPPSLARFAVELDQRFLTELAHTTVLFNELFDQSGRKQLIKVPHTSPAYARARPACFQWWHGNRRGIALLNCGLAPNFSALRHKERT